MVAKEIYVGMSFGNYELVNNEYYNNGQYKRQEKDNSYLGRNASYIEKAVEYYDNTGSKIAWGRKNRDYNPRTKQTMYSSAFQTEHLYYTGKTTLPNKGGIFTRIESDKKYAEDINHNGIVDDFEIFDK